MTLPEDMKHWTLISLQTRLIKTGGRLVHHARRLVFQLAEVQVSREMLLGCWNELAGCARSLGSLLWEGEHWCQQRGRPEQTGVPREKLGLEAGDAGILRWEGG